MLYARYQGAVAVDDSKIYVIGGWTHSPGLPHPEVQVYDTTTDTWSTAASLPQRSGSGVAATIDGKVFHLDPYERIWWIKSPVRLRSRRQ